MIKHTINAKTVFSIYGHLKNINIPEGVAVKEGDLIGTVGNEGYSFGNHLLWDINITPENTYAFWGCPEYNNGYTFNVIANIVNQGLCREYLLLRTADPIAWIESQGGTLALGNSSLPSLSRRRYAVVPLAPTTTSSTSTTTKTTTVTVQKSLSTVIVTPKEVSKNTVALATNDTQKTIAGNSTSIEIANTNSIGEDFLKKYTITMTPSFGNRMTVGQTSSLVVSVTDKDGKPYAGVLPKEITIMPSQSLFTISPQVIRLTNSDGKAIALISADKEGTSDIVISYNMKAIAKISVTVK